MAGLTAVEICAGAGGQALGLELAGFGHKLAIELDENAVATLRENRPDWDVRHGDVADKRVWDPQKVGDFDLLAGGVPCPPFSIAGKQLGAEDERDLFAWAVEVAGKAFNLSKNPAYDACKSGQIPSFRIGKKIVVPTAPLRKMLGIEMK